ncbi:MAG TPA: TVP38/TMEM64 family protein [Symbiobacteriaceae bacterium]|nr:TVP38/TMEM64 family protein [Symbiobacteriaceae bacterium]
MPAPRRNQLITATLALATLLAAYWLVPSVHNGVGAAVSLLSTADVTPVRDYLLSFGVWAPLIAFGLHFLAAVLAPLPSFVVTFAVAMVFGWAWGTVISWTAALISSGVCFGIARVYGRPLVEKVVPASALTWFDRFFAQYGTHSVLLARLIPVVSFDFVSYGAGLTNMSLWKFLIYTGLGMLPATVVYSYLAARGTSSVIWLFYAFVAVGAMAVLASAVRPLMERRRRNAAAREGAAWRR